MRLMGATILHMQCEIDNTDDVIAKEDHDTTQMTKTPSTLTACALLLYAMINNAYCTVEEKIKEDYKRRRRQLRQSRFEGRARKDLRAAILVVHTNFITCFPKL